MTESIRKRSDVNLSVGRVSISYFGRLKLKEIYVEDHHQDTLLYVRELKSSLLGFRNLLNNTPDLGFTSAEGLTLNMKRYSGEETDNLSVVLDKLRTEPTGEKTPFKLLIREINVTNGYYTYVDENLEVPVIIEFNDLNMQAENLQVVDSDITVNINTLSAREGRGLDIVHLQTRFFYSPTQMLLDGLILETPHSYLDANIDLVYVIDDFSDFVNKVMITGNFENSRISTNDLRIFYREFGENNKFFITSKINGTLNDLVLDDLKLTGMDRSSIDGRLRIEGAFTENLDGFRLTGNFNQLSTNYYDLVNLIPSVLKKSIPINLRDFGNLQLQGNTTITGNSLNADVFITTLLGSAKADVRMANFSNSALTTYEGNIVVNNFNLGRLLNRTDIEKTSFNLYVDGRGFTQGSLNTQIRGRVSRLVYNKYEYSDVLVMGTVRNSVFNGNLVSQDPNLQMEFNGLVDISQSENVYDFEASIGYADLNKLNIISRDSISIFKGDIIMNMQGNDLDNISGNILLANTTYQNQNDLYYFDDLSVTSNFDEEGIRTIAVNSPDVISGQVTGIFRISEVGALVGNALGSIYTNYRPNITTTNQYMEFDFDIYNKIVEVFYPQITLAPNTFIRGRIESDESEFRLTFRSPKIEAFGNMLEDINLQVDNTNPLYNTFLEADSVATPYYNFSEFSLINVTLRDTLFIRSEFQGGSQNSDVFNLNLFHTINEDNRSVVGVQRSDVKFRDNVWYLNENSNRNNKITFSNTFRDIAVDSLELTHQDESIRLSGVMRDSTYKDFRIEFENVDIDKITPEIKNFDLEGILDGRLHLLQEDGAFFPNTSMVIDGFAINDIPMGRLDLEVEGNEDFTFFNVDASLTRKGFESLRAVGEINAAGNSPSIDLDVSLQNVNLAAFSPLGGDAIDNIRGFASGDATVTGSYLNPDITGALDLEDAGFRIPYLNIDFNLNGIPTVELTQQQFNFNNIQILDIKHRTTGLLDGNISHRNFRKWFLDLDISSDRILVLDTQAEVDALYYGTAFIDGNASIKGPTDELVINVTAATERGTIFKIPLSDAESVGDNSYIHFLSPEEKAFRLAGIEIEIPEVKGLELNFDLDITNDAEVEIVVDQTSGSSLRGRGAGSMLIEINTNGKFNMWGDFVVFEGVYNFKYAGLVQKLFRVQPGGNITWNGSPTNAELDVSAIYEVDANPAILLENPSINRKIPVEVVILLQGQLTQPDLTFDVQFPNASSAVRSELGFRMNDRATRELHALFLVTQGSFYTDFAIGQNAWSGTLVERASSLVNDIFADEDGKFQVGVNYVQGERTPDQQTVDRFGLTLSTQISNRILINGAVGVPVGGVTESVLVGDVEIQFLLNEDGTLRAKIFNRENNIQFIGEEIGFTQGLGLSYSVDFDTFRELIRKILNKEIVKSEAIREEEESAKTIAPSDARNRPK